MSQMLHTFGKVILLRGSEPLPKEPYQLKMICLSEDDGGALVWNYNSYLKHDFFIKDDFSKSQLSRKISIFIIYRAKYVKVKHYLFLLLHINIFNFLKLKVLINFNIF